MDGEAIPPVPILVLDKRDTRSKAGSRDVLDDLFGTKPHDNDKLGNTNRREIAHDLGQNCPLAEGEQCLRHLMGVRPQAAPSPSSNDNSFHL
jgi:hypothetical protein